VNILTLTYWNSCKDII